MLKNDEFNIFALAQKNNLKRFIYFKVELRDKIKYDIELLDGYLNLFDKSEEKTHVVYACQTKYVTDQKVPPRFNSNWITYMLKTGTYNYEISTIEILVECSDKNFKYACQDLDTNRGKEMENLLCRTLEYFAYKYNLAVSGNDFIEVADLCVGIFQCFSYYRDKKSGEYLRGKFIVTNSISIMKSKDENNMTFQNIINKEIPPWKYFLNKTKYLYITHNNLECIINAAITIESYIIFLIKKENKYNRYMEEMKGYLGFENALRYAKNKKIISEEMFNDFKGGYDKLSKQRSIIIHGSIDTPMVEREEARIAYETIIDLFINIDKEHVKENNLQNLNKYFEDDFNKMNNIIKKYEDGNYESAIKELDINIDNNIFKDLSIFTRAKCFIKMQDSYKAIDDLRTCISNRYKLIQCYNMLGMELASINKHDEAKKEYINGIQLDPQYPEYYYNLGISQQYLKEYDEAISSYNEAIKIRPEHSYYYNLGTAYYYKGDYKKTLSNYNKAIQLEPNNCKYLYERAFLYETLKRPKNAEKDIVKCLELYKDEPHIAFIRERIYQIGVLYQNEEKYKDAIRMFNRGCKVDNNLYAFHQARGNCYRSLGETNKARKDYETCLNLSTSRYSDLINLTYLYLDIKDIDSASVFFKELKNKYMSIDKVKDCADIYYFDCYQQGRISKDMFLKKLQKYREDIRKTDFYKRISLEFGEEMVDRFFEIK